MVSPCFQPYPNLLALILCIMQSARHLGALWAITSSVMSDQMESTCGAIFHSPSPHHTVQCTSVAFVDDTTLCYCSKALC